VCESEREKNREIEIEKERESEREREREREREKERERESVRKRERESARKRDEKQNCLGNERCLRTISRAQLFVSTIIYKRKVTCSICKRKTYRTHTVNNNTILNVTLHVQVTVQSMYSRGKAPTWCDWEKPSSRITS